MAMQIATKVPASEDPATTLPQATKRQVVKATYPALPHPASEQGIFGKLPAELKVTIVEELDYLSAVSLAATNGYWRLFDPVSEVHVLEKTKFVIKVQCFKKHRFIEDPDCRFAQALKAMRQVQSLHRSQERPLHPSEVQSLLPLINELRFPSVQISGRATLESWSPHEGFACFKCYRVKKTASFKQRGQRVFLSKTGRRYYSANPIWSQTPCDQDGFAKSVAVFRLRWWVLMIVCCMDVPSAKVAAGSTKRTAVTGRGLYSVHHAMVSLCLGGRTWDVVLLTGGKKKQKNPKASNET
ncbi:hypothetical protein HDK77DRAFT_471821 [Phyllosticta capitalensis]